MDWKEALGSLDRDLFPKGEDAPKEQEEISSVKSKADTLRVILDKKQRKGKTATIIEGFSCEDNELKSIARDLKTRIGVGGSARGGEILLQGDCLAKVSDVLREMGYKVKK